MSFFYICDYNIYDLRPFFFLFMCIVEAFKFIFFILIFFYFSLLDTSALRILSMEYYLPASRDGSNIAGIEYGKLDSSHPVPLSFLFDPFLELP